jgi:hypothetical protein
MAIRPSSHKSQTEAFGHRLRRERNVGLRRRTYPTAVPDPPARPTTNPVPPDCRPVHSNYQTQTGQNACRTPKPRLSGALSEAP